MHSRPERGSAPAEVFLVKLPKIDFGFWHVLGIFGGSVASVALYVWAFARRWPNVPILSPIAHLIAG
jgi:hypothetical protein